MGRTIVLIIAEVHHSVSRSCNDTKFWSKALGRYTTVFHGARAGARAPRATARAGARVTRLGLLLLSAILVACALLSVAAILSEAGAQLGSDSVATTAAAPVSTRPPPMMPQLARQAERQHRTKEQRSASMPQVQRRVTDPQHGEADARMRVLGILVLVLMVPFIVVVETVRLM